MSLANAINRIRISVKLPVIMVALTLGAIAIVGVFAFVQARGQVVKDAEERLSSVGSARVRLLESYAADVRDTLDFLSGSSEIKQALADFSGAYGSLKDPMGELQRIFIDENPNPVGDRELLEAPEGSGMYGWSHSRFHPMLVDIETRNGFYDVFLINAAGAVVYTVEKEIDFAANLLEGEYASSGLGDVVRTVLAGGTEGGFIFSDYAPYAPSEGARAAFAGYPIVRDGEVAGVLAVQLPIEPLNVILQDMAGLGKDGSGYLVGADKLLRSDDHHSEEPTALIATVETPEVELALEGESGIARAMTNEGNEAFVYYAPMNLLGETWALILEMPVEEFMAPVNALRNAFLIKGGIIVAVAAVISLILSRSIAGPIGAVGGAMRRVEAHDYATEVPGRERGDEIGDIAKSLESFRGSLIEADALAVEAAAKSAAFENSSSATMLVDKNFTITFVNKAMVKLFTDKTEDFRGHLGAFDPTALVGKPMDVFHRDASHQRRLMADPSKLPMAATIKVGGTYLGLTVSAVNGKDGTFDGAVLEWKDTTEAMRQGAILGSIEANQCLAEFTPTGQLIAANAGFGRALGAEVAALKGRQAETFIALDAAGGPDRTVWTKAQAGEAQFGRFRIEEGGRVFYLEGSLSPMLDHRGEVQRLVLIASDVTEARRAIEAAEAERRDAAAAQARVVEALRVGLGRLSEGDLTASIDETFSADYEQLRTDFNAALGTVGEAMRGVVETAHSIRGESKEISSAAEDLSARAETQAATLEETAAALDELTASVKSAAEGAGRAAEVVASARANAEASGEVVSEAVHAMSEIEASSTQISKIISVIDDIAFQTNLLALNAGVEAARAGDAGRGFAVVASEVRALAQRSSDAAREINGLISASGGHVKRGVDLVGQAGRALQSIFESVSDIAEHVSGIATSSQEQSRGLAEINVAVNQLDQVTQQNVAMFEETTAASHALNREAEALTSTVARFRTGAEPAATKPARAAAKPAARRSAAPIPMERPRKPAPAPTSKTARAAAAVALAEAAPVDGGWAEF